MKNVRITLELSGSYLSLLRAKCELSRYTEWAKGGDNPPELDAGAVLSLLVLCEARGAPEEQTHAATPMMWRNGGPVIIHEERRVYDDDTGEQLSGPVLKESTEHDDTDDTNRTNGT